MKRLIFFLVLLCSYSVLSAQKIVKRYQQASLSEVLRDLNRLQDNYIINFMYDELEDYRVTTDIRTDSVIDAIRQAIGKFPVRVVQHREHELYVECIRKQSHCFIGKVVDERNQPMAFANVVVFSPADSALLGGGIADESGMFSIPIKQEQILARISHVGYNTVWRSCDVRKSEKICLQPKSQQLNGVSVVGKEVVLFRRAGTIVFDTRYVVGAVNAADLLRHSPGVLFDGDNITLLGTAGIIFCVNGKEQRLDKKGILEMLRSYSSDDVQQIEITQTPSAGFSSTSNAGLINLVIKKREKEYIGGSAGYMHTHYEECGDETYANLHCNKGKLMTSLNVVGTWDKTRYHETNDIAFMSYLRSNVNNGRIKKNNYTARCQIDYNLSNKLAVGAFALYANGNRMLESSGIYDYKMTDEHAMKVNTMVSQTSRREEVQTFALNTNAVQKLEGQKTRINYNLDYYRMKLDDDRTSEAAYSQTGISLGDFNYKNDIGQIVTNYSAKVDVNVADFRFGSHYAYTQSDRKLTDTWTSGYSEWSKFTYDEQVLSAYAEYNGTLGSRLSFNLGGRYEQTWTAGQIQPISFVLPYRTCYGRFFPSFGVTFKQANLHSFSCSLNGHIDRPNIINVNPDTLYNDAFHASAGNPYLKYSYIYKAMVGYTYKGILCFDLFYSYHPDRMAQMTFAGGQMIFSTWGNVADEQNFGINSFYSFGRLSWMDAALTQRIYWRSFKANRGYTLFNLNGWNYIGMLQTTFYFDRQRKWTANLSANYISREKDLTRTLCPRYKIDIGVQYRFWKDRLKLTLACRNLLVSRIRGEEFLGMEIMKFDNQHDYRQLHLTFTYNWGTALRKNQKQYNSDELQKRVVNDFK